MLSRAKRIKLLTALNPVKGVALLMESFNKEIKQVENKIPIVKDYATPIAERNV